MKFILTVPVDGRQRRNEIYSNSACGWSDSACGWSDTDREEMKFILTVPVDGRH